MVGVVACLSRPLHFFFLSFSFILIIAQVPCTTILLHPNLVVYRADLTGEETSLRDVNLPFSFPKSSRRHQFNNINYPQSSSGFSVALTFSSADHYHVPPFLLLRAPFAYSF